MVTVYGFSAVVVVVVVVVFTLKAVPVSTQYFLTSVRVDRLRTERHPDVWHSGGLESDGFKC